MYIYEISIHTEFVKIFTSDTCFTLVSPHYDSEKGLHNDTTILNYTYNRPHIRIHYGSIGPLNIIKEFIVTEDELHSNDVKIGHWSRVK